MILNSCIMYTYRYDSDAKITSEEEDQENVQDKNPKKRKAPSKLAKPSKKRKEV